MTKLSVNVNKLATLRNARGKNNPDVLAWSERILEYGAFGITVHPRPDGRHIRFDDVKELAKLVRSFNQRSHLKREFNVEGYPSPDLIDLVNEVKPDQVTLVPDPPDVITSNAGWAVAENETQLARVLNLLKSSRARVSLFLDPAQFSPKDEMAISRLSAIRYELYTEAYANHYGSSNEVTALQSYQAAAARLLKLGRELNAGHDLDQRNLGKLIRAIPQIKEVSIGHALICEALNDGMETTINNYLQILGTDRNSAT